METIKNIVLGLLIGVVICMGFEINTLKKELTAQDRAVEQQYYDKRQAEDRTDPTEIFQRFFDMVLEFEKQKQAQNEKAQTDEQESTK